MIKLICWHSYWNSYLRNHFEFISVLFFVFERFVPESARWLLSRNRIEEAKSILVNAARVNKTVLPDDFSLEQDAPPTASLKALCGAKALLCRSLIIFFNWLVTDQLLTVLGVVCIISIHRHIKLDKQDLLG